VKRPDPVSANLKADLALLAGRAYHVQEWAEEALRLYHRAAKALRGADGERLHKLHDWVLTPLTLWPLEICDLLKDALAAWRQHAALGEELRLCIDLLPEPPDKTTCEILAKHEHEVQQGRYEHVLGNQAKYAQQEAELKSNQTFQAHWTRIKEVFEIRDFVDHKGVIRRTMGTERNLRPEWPNRIGGAKAAFQSAFDAFCMRWNLYGMQHDEPLLLKLAVNLTPFATMIVVPAYWSLDPKRDIRWDAIAQLHRSRARQRQGAALKEGRELRRKQAAKLLKYDAKAAELGLRGEAKLAYLIEQLGLPPGTSDRTLRRLRQEFRGNP
jgi:hypothetical protein